MYLPTVKLEYIGTWQIYGISVLLDIIKWHLKYNIVLLIMQI